MKRCSIFIILLLTIAGCSDHRASEKKFPARSVTINGSTYNYRIYLPEKRDSNSMIPVMLYLHGSGSRGDDNRSQLNDISSSINDDPDRFPFIIVIPQCRPDTFWAGEMMEQAMAALDQTVNEFNGDPDRLYLAGFSMGGYGVWQFAVTHPNKFTALVPIAGGIVPNGPVSEKDMAMLSPQVRAVAVSDHPYQAFAKAIGNTPVWVLHGSDDDAVPVAGSRKIVEALKAAGNPSVNYTEFENVGHISIVNAFRQSSLFEWLAQQRRTPDK